jgi:hypothetical protein
MIKSLCAMMVCVMPAMAGDADEGVVGGWPKPCASVSSRGWWATTTTPDSSRPTDCYPQRLTTGELSVPRRPAPRRRQHPNRPLSL